MKEAEKILSKNLLGNISCLDELKIHIYNAMEEYAQIKLNEYIKTKEMEKRISLEKRTLPITLA